MADGVPAFTLRKGNPSSYFFEKVERDPRDFYREAKKQGIHRIYITERSAMANGADEWTVKVALLYLHNERRKVVYHSAIQTFVLDKDEVLTEEDAVDMEFLERRLTEAYRLYTKD